MEKIYTWKQLQEICTKQGYKLARLENYQGETMTPYNKIKTPLTKQFTVMRTRLNNEILPDGIYYVCLAHTINRSHRPDRYAIQKGKIINTPALNDHNQQHQFQLKPESLLTSEKAIELLTEISTLKAKVSALELENSYLQQELDDMEQGKGLEEGVTSKGEMFSFLKENAPALVGGISEWLKLENRKVDLEEKKLKIKSKPKPQFQRITPGSQAHIALIEMYDKKGDDEKLEREIEKIKTVNAELYQQLIDKYFEPENSNENNNEEEEETNE